MYCPWEPATFFFISSNVPLLINYSHFIAIFAAMSVGFIIFINNPRQLFTRLLLLFSFLFSFWALLDVSLWATNDPAFVMFAWALQVLIEPITYAIAFYLFYLFVHGHLPRLWINAIIFVMLMPLVLLLPTTFNLESILLSTCESIEGPIAKYYTYVLNIFFTTAIITVGARNLHRLDQKRRNVMLLFGIGLTTFLLSFTSGNIISSFTDDWTISQYGLFGMPIFAFLIAYSIVQFEAFKMQVAGAQVLVIVLWALVCSLLFVDSELLVVIAGLTLLFTTIAGYLLIRSVKREFEQRLEIEKLAQKLEKANKRLKVLDQMKSEFVSIASHQLRSPLTSIRGYASMLLEGSYGKLTKKGKEAVERIVESSRFMALSVEDYLNVSRIEAGRMKYEMSDFNLKEITEQIVDDVRPEAMKKGLALTFKSSNLDSRGRVHGDIGKTQQIIHNLLDNSMKYTPKGSITVVVDDNTKKKQVTVSVTDTGVGMSHETASEVFEKFVRARNANEVNVTGTGLGLYVAKQMAEGMGGTIHATSPGEGKGSTFTLTLRQAQ